MIIKKDLSMLFVINFFVYVLLLFNSDGIKAAVDFGVSLSDDLVLPELIGCAVSEFQNSGRDMYTKVGGGAGSNWSVFECKSAAVNQHNPLRTHGLSGNGTGLWDNIEKHVELLKEVGSNCFRFSIEWAMVEPMRGCYSQSALDHYAKLIYALREARIEPMITLHHFTHPFWFEQRGGWANDENIADFVRFCETVFDAFQDKVKLWVPINEIAPFAYQGYFSGVFPPGVSNPWLAAKVMRNMLMAHCQVYKALKKIDKNGCQIGIIHNYLCFKSADTSRFALFNLAEKIPTSLLNYIFNDAMLHFLKTGTLFPHNPFLKLVINDATLCFDFIGLNFYSRVMIKSDIYNAVCNLDPAMAIFPTCGPGEIMTDMPFPISPESFFDAILTMGSITSVPLYITENGCPDTADANRMVYIKEYLAQLSKAIKQGINIKGYFYWTLVDNFEWNYGYTQKFGLYSYDRENNAYTLKDSGRFFRDIILNAKRV